MEDNKDTKVEEAVVGEEKTTKSYTQEDIDNSFNAGVKKAKTEMQKDEKYKEFLEWKKTNQNDSEKLTELENSNIAKDQKILELETLLKIGESDTKKEFRKFVASEVSKLVNDTTNFETALKKYKSENPQYFGETFIKKVQTSPTLNGGVKAQTTNDIMNNIIRSARNND